MSMRKFLLAVGVMALALGTAAPRAEGPNLGKPVTPSDLKAWDINVFPDGTNLPPGSGKAAAGAKLYGGKTIANFWPAATTLFDFIRRAMPYTAPNSLTDQEVYDVTAYLMAANKLIGENDEINAKTLPQVKMPNRDNFIIRFPDRI